MNRLKELARGVTSDSSLGATAVLEIKEKLLELDTPTLPGDTEGADKSEKLGLADKFATIGELTLELSGEQGMPRSASSPAPRYRTSIYSRVQVLVSAPESILALKRVFVNEYSCSKRVLTSI
jgi:hypothetical protein